MSQGRETYASSQRLAEKRRWIERSSISDSERKYESISLPIGVVRSTHTHRSVARLVGALEAQHNAETKRLRLATHLPGNFTGLTAIPSAFRCSSRSATWVLLPDLSRPSTTINVPRIFLSGIAMNRGTRRGSVLERKG